MPAIVRLGDQNLIRTDDNDMGIDYKVKRIIVHPKYNRDTKLNDIALLELEKEVVFDKVFIRPACLQQNLNFSSVVIAVIRTLTFVFSVK